MPDKPTYAELEQRILDLEQAETGLGHSEEALWQSQERFHKMFCYHDAIMLLIDPESGAIADANKAAELFYGYSHQQLCNLRIQDINQLSDEEVARERQKALSEQRNYFIFPHKLMNGHIRTVEVHSTPLQFDEKTMLFSIIHDISERKQAEEALRTNQYYLEKAQELGQIGTWELDLRANTLRWTDENCRIFGVPPGSMVNYEIFISKVHPDDREYVHREWKAGVAGKPYDIEHRLLIDGVTSWVREKADINFDENGVAVSAIGFTQDITERKRAEAALRKSEAMQSKMVANIGDVIVIIDQNGINQYKSPNVTTLFGWQPEELLGKSTWDTVHPDDLEQAQMFLTTIAKDPGSRGTTELRYKRKDGTYVWIEINVSNLLSDPDVKGIFGNYHDITERKQAEEELRESERKNKAWIENSPVCTKMVDLDFNLQFMSESGIRELQIDDIKEFYGKPYPFHFYPDSFKIPMRENLKKAKETGTIITQEASVNDIVGNKLWYHSTIVPVMDDQGKPDYLLVVSLETTKRKQAEEELKQSNVYFSNLIDNTPGAIAILNKRSFVTRINKKFTHLFGYSSEEAVGKTLNELVVPENKHEESDLLCSFYGLNESHGKETETVIIDKNGNLIDVSVVGSSIYFGGEFTGIFAIYQDITERKKTEEALRKSQEELHNILQTSIEGYWLVDLQGRFLDVNDAYQRMSGYQRAELLEMSIQDIESSETAEQTAQHIQELVLKGSGRFESAHRRKDGSTFDVDVSVQYQAFEGGRLVVFIRDISEKLKLESELRQSQKLEAVGTMVGGISHELNNILQSLFLFGGLVKDDLPEDEELRANFEQMLMDGERAKNIVKQILTFSRKSSVDMQPREMHALLLEFLVLERASLPAHIELKQDIDTDCGLVLCDSTQVHQIILNLCNNAQHAMEESGGILTVSLKQVRESLNNVDPETDALELKVTDTGHGIDAEDLEKIFDPFFTTRRFGKGTGLGLSVVHGIVDMMGGQITVTSELDKGTTFRLVFPVVHQAKMDNEELKPVTPSDKLKQTILLVDDEDSIRNATQTVLTRKGFTVTSASNGKLALDLFTADPNKYDLVVTDQSMPKMSGAELTKAIRTSQSKTPIILSTGELGVEDKKEFKNIGITAFIQKPWTAEELITRIRELDD